MINTYNESSLHKSLKEFYANISHGKTEQHVGFWICDVLSENGSVIEIQTSNVSCLHDKISDLLKSGRCVTIVHPIVRKKYIETVNTDGNILSRRKSPKAESTYAMFRQITGIYALLLDPKFTLEIPEIEIIETRQKTNIPVQTLNKSRHFLKNWLVIDKKLEKIGQTLHFTSRKDYLSMLPFSKNELFSVNDVYNKLLNNKIALHCPLPHIRSMIWVLVKMNLIVLVKTVGRKKIYKISD